MTTPTQPRPAALWPLYGARIFGRMAVMEMSQGPDDPPSLSAVVRLSEYRHRRHRTYFTRGELSALLGLYSSRVISGEWRDYAIDHAMGLALFSVFRHTMDRPLYTIAKTAGPRGTEFALFDGRRRLKRSAALTDIIADLNARLRLVKG